jgi:tetratricopeptide (TPR) repeat protein
MNGMADGVGIRTDSSMKASRRAEVHRWGMLAAVTVLGPILVLAVIEIGLRAAGIGYNPELLVACTVRGVPASCYNLFFAAPYFPAGMVQTPRLYSIPTKKAADTYRIFVLGESAAMGDPDPAYGFSRYLEVMLRQRFPTMKFEVVNTGSVAINSHVVLRVAEGLAKQQPDLFIIYSGNNEVVGPYGPGTVLTSTGMSLPVVRSSIFFRSTRVGQLVTKLGTQKQEWRGMELFLDKQVPATSPLLQQAYANFEGNLRKTIEVAQKAGAKVIVSTAATNLRDCAPFASLHRDGLTPEQLRSWSSFVQQGSESEAANSYADAVKAHRAALAIDDRYAELEFRIARILSKLGDLNAARDHFARARDLDTLRFRADSRINEINRSVAASIPGVTLVDADALLAAASPDGVIGSELVYEHVHLTPLASYRLARSIFLEIAKNIPTGAGAAADSDVLPQGECEHRLALTSFDRSRIAAEMLRRLQKAPFTNQMNHSEQLARLISMAGPSRESPNDTALQYQWAIGQWPDDGMLHHHFGMFLFRYNRVAAAQELGLAQPWDGYPVFLPDGTQVR